jgi:Chlorophyll A-B binding protein
MSVSTKTPPSAVQQDRNAWIPGFTPQAEIWNGRFAMLGFVAALITEFASGEGVLHFWNIMHYGTTMK